MPEQLPQKVKLQMKKETPASGLSTCGGEGVKQGVIF